MRIHKFLIIVFLFLSLSSFSQTTLTSLSPTRFYTQSSPIPMTLMIYGKNIWPDGLTHTEASERIKVYFKLGDRQQEITGRAGISAHVKGVYFSSADWARTPGNIEVFMIINGARTNSLWLQIEETPKIAPIISDIAPATFKIGEKADKYYFRIYGKNFGEESSTSATIGGSKAGVGWWSLQDGVMDVWIPKSLINTSGTYPVVVNTAYGSSNVTNIKIVDPNQVAILQKTNRPAENPAIGNMQMRQMKPATVNTTIAHIPPRFQVNTDMASMEVIKAIRIKLDGVIAHGEDMANLYKYILELDNVFFVENNLQATGTNGNINIILKGRGVEKQTLEAVKLKIENKIKEMSLNGAVVIE